MTDESKDVAALREIAATCAQYANSEISNIQALAHVHKALERAGWAFIEQPDGTLAPMEPQ